MDAIVNPFGGLKSDPAAVNPPPPPPAIAGADKAADPPAFPNGPAVPPLLPGTSLFPPPPPDPASGPTGAGQAAGPGTPELLFEGIGAG